MSIAVLANQIAFVAKMRVGVGVWVGLIAC